MGSRIREDVKHLFQCFCEVARPQTDKEAWIIQKFPESYRDEEVLKSVPNFAYPCEFENTAVQHYSFVLTSIDSKWTYGFCRHHTRSETALVVLSYLPWHETFYKFLNTVADLTSGPHGSELWNFLEAVYVKPVPDPGGILQVSYNRGQNNFICQCPNQFQLPSIPDNRNLTEYYSAVDAHNMMVIFASMLYERRVVFTSKRLSRLSACVQAANAILYPMNWQHIFIPVLPMALSDYLSAPMPFLIGVPHAVLQRQRMSDLGEVVILDADSNKVQTPFDDLESLPVEVVTSLRKHLHNRTDLLGDGVSRAFLRALVQLIGGYRDALKFYQGEKITFNREAFVESRPSSMQPFLRKMLELQIFEQFIEERLAMLNAGLGFSDEFELEACNYSDKSSFQLKQKYKEWASTMRKEGSAFFKSVKSKANPAMKSAVKSVKERSKEVKARSRSAYKGIRSRLKDMQGQGTDTMAENGGSSSSNSSLSRAGSLPSKPRSAPASPTAAPRRSHSTANSNLPTSAAKSYRKDPQGNRRTSIDQRGRSLSGIVLDSPDSSPGSLTLEKGTPSLQISPLDMDLMGDLQDVIFRKCLSLGEDEVNVTEPEKPPVDRSLKPVRSLDPPSSSSSQPNFSSNWGFQHCTPIPLSPQRSAPPPVAPRTPTTLVHSFTSPFSTSSSPFMVVGPDREDPSSSVFVVACPPQAAPTSEVARIPPPRSRKPRAPQPQPVQRAAASSSPAERDLIRLDSTPSEDDFDPLKSSSRGGNIGTTSYSAELLSNPLYPAFTPANLQSQEAQTATSKQQELELLKEYGLDFDSASRGSWLHSASNPFSPMSNSTPQNKSQWATFE